MLSLLVSLVLSAGYTIRAEDKNGKRMEFAKFEIVPKITAAQVEVMEGFGNVEFKPVRFLLEREDGVCLTARAPKSLKSVTFNILVVDDVPTAIELDPNSRKPGCHVNVIRSRQMAIPQPKPEPQDPQEGGLLGLLMKFWYVPLIFFVMNKFMKPK